MAKTKRKNGGRVNDSWTVKELRAEGKRRKIKGLRPDQRKDELIDMLNDTETNYTAFQGKGEAVGTRAENEEEKRRRAEEARKAREDELAAVLEEPGRIVDPSLTDVERQRQRDARAEAAARRSSGITQNRRRVSRSTAIPDSGTPAATGTG